MEKTIKKISLQSAVLIIALWGLLLLLLSRRMNLDCSRST